MTATDNVMKTKIGIGNPLNMHVIRLRSNMKAKAKTIKGSHGLFLGLENIMSWSSKQKLGHFSVVIDKSFYVKN